MLPRIRMRACLQNHQFSVPGYLWYGMKMLSNLSQYQLCQINLSLCILTFWTVIKMLTSLIFVIHLLPCYLGQHYLRHRMLHNNLPHNFWKTLPYYLRFTSHTCSCCTTWLHVVMLPVACGGNCLHPQISDVVTREHIIHCWSVAAVGVML